MFTRKPERIWYKQEDKKIDYEDADNPESEKEMVIGYSIITILGNYPGRTRLGSTSCLQESHREFRVNKRIRRHYGDVDNPESVKEMVIAYGCLRKLSREARLGSRELRIKKRIRRKVMEMQIIEKEMVIA
ncbi:uncharacterized protein [Periplaneta americana]|uniref:uncharacterized protein n=1 Tax=Periplaneta americana TaxID=6978 RepID=UPI0037E868AD